MSRLTARGPGPGGTGGAPRAPRRPGLRAPLLLLAALLLAPSLASPAGASSPRGISIGVNIQQPPHHDLARAANIGWVRITLRWDQVNPRPDEWSFAITDGDIYRAHLYGMRILATLSYVPPWLGGGINRNIPPSSTTEWAEFVRRVAERYDGVVDAYEIWNEPNLVDPGIGVGWNRPLHQAPTYADFVHAAAVEIRAHAPGTLVVAPAHSSRRNERTAQLFTQLETTRYPDGHVSDFIDVISTHSNIFDRSGPLTAADQISKCGCPPVGACGVLDYLALHNPRNLGKPVWITEFGWQSGQVGPERHREYVCKLLRMMAGHYRPEEVCVDDWDIRRAFLYKLHDFPGQSDGVFDASGNPKPVVTEYLWWLRFPATQPPVRSEETAPSCLGGDVRRPSRPAAKP
jgi:hypothetical protein